MKASELIQELQKQIDEFADHEVVFSLGLLTYPVSFVWYLEDQGMSAPQIVVDAEEWSDKAGRRHPV